MAKSLLGSPTFTASPTISPTYSVSPTFSASPTVTVTPNGCVWMGDSGGSVGSSSGASWYVAYMVTAPISGQVASISAHTAFAGAYDLALAIYDHDGGNNRPGNLMSESVQVPAPSAMLYTLAVPSVAVTAGQTYWLVHRGSAWVLVMAFSGGTQLTRNGTGPFPAVYGPPISSDPFSGRIQANICYFGTATPTQTPSMTWTNSPTPTNSPTRTVTETSTPTNSPTRTVTETSTETPMSTGTWTRTITETDTPTATRTWTRTVTLTQTPTITGTFTPSLTGTDTPTATASDSPTQTVSVTATRTATQSETVTVTPTTSPTASASPSVTGTQTRTVTPTPSVTGSPTLSASPTATFTASMSSTVSSTATASPTNSATRTATPLPATATNSPTTTPMPSATQSFTFSPTLPPSPTITPTFSISDTPIPTATADVPAVLSKNAFKPAEGGSVAINMKASQGGEVTCRVYNVAGDLVMTPFQASVSAGQWFQANWDGKNDQRELVSSGVYFISIRGAGIRTIRKVVVLK